MKKWYRTLTAVEYAFVVSVMASFIVLGVAGLLFGFQISQWSQWEGVWVGLSATISGVIGAFVGLRIALNQRLMNLKNHNARWIKH
jgi:hypothetical protein